MAVTVKYQTVSELKMDCRTIKTDHVKIEFGGGDDEALASLFTYEGGKRNEITFNRDDARRLAEALITWANEAE